MITIDKIADYEEGLIRGDDAIKLFSTLVSSGVIDSMSDGYKLCAQIMVEDGIISKDGDILKSVYDLDREERL